MLSWGAYGLAFLLAATITWMELITTQYPRTIALFWKHSRDLWLYPCLYGILAAGAVGLAQVGIVRVDLSVPAAGADGPQDSRPDSSIWLLALTLGVATKALMHIRLFNVSSGSQAFPVGTESLVQLFEPWMLRNISLDEFYAVDEFLDRKVATYSKLATVRKTILSRLPDGIPDEERAAFKVDLNNAANEKEAMKLYLRLVGVRNFNRVFP